MAYMMFNYNPNDPNSMHEEAANASFLMTLSSLFSIGALASVIYFVVSFVNLIKGKISYDILYSIGTMVIVAIIVFFIICFALEKEGRKKFAKKYFLFLFGGVLDVIAIVAMVVSINRIRQNQGGVLLLVCAIIMIVLSSVVVAIINRYVEGLGPLRVRLFTPKGLAPNSNIYTISPDTITDMNKAKTIFCHKCGEELPCDSKFCKTCGEKLK